MTQVNNKASYVMGKLADTVSTVNPPKAIAGKKTNSDNSISGVSAQ